MPHGVSLIPERTTSRQVNYGALNLGEGEQYSEGFGESRESG